MEHSVSINIIHWEDTAPKTSDHPFFEALQITKVHTRADQSLHKTQTSLKRSHGQVSSPTPSSSCDNRRNAHPLLKTTQKKNSSDVENTSRHRCRHTKTCRAHVTPRATKEKPSSPKAIPTNPRNLLGEHVGRSLLNSQDREAQSISTPWVCFPTRRSRRPTSRRHTGEIFVPKMTSSPEQECRLLNPEDYVTQSISRPWIHLIATRAQKQDGQQQEDEAPQR